MKNIYDLFNHAEDDGDVISENERLELTDIEKRRIYNRVLFDSEEQQWECRSDRHQDNQCDRKERQFRNKQQSEGELQKTVGQQENQEKTIRKGRKFKKMLTAAACMAIICAVGFTAGAAVKEYLYKNTQYDYREKLDSTESEASADNTAEDAIDGVNIRMTEARMQDDSLTFDCTFTFDGDISEMQKEMEQWAIIEGRNAIGDQFFDNTEVYVDGINVLDDDIDYVI